MINVMSAEDREALSFLGLSGLEVEVYARLLSVRAASAADLAEALGQDETSLVASVEGLIAKDLVLREGRDQVRSVDPRLSLARLVDHHEVELAERQRLTADARRAAQKLILRVEEAERTQRLGLEEVHGRSLASERAATMVSMAQDEVLSMITLLPSPEGQLQARPVDEALLERGVCTRMLVLAGQVRAAPEYRRWLEALEVEGTRTRIAATLPMRLIVVDRSVALVPIDPADPSSGVTVLHHGALVALAVELFERVWAASEDLQERGPAEEEHYQPSPLEREVLRLLGAGQKDEAVARRVGISLRSIRRLMSGLSDQLGSKSRFQMGVIASEQGWASHQGKGGEAATASSDPAGTVAAQTDSGERRSSSS